jgi:hypothetical protein
MIPKGYRSGKRGCGRARARSFYISFVDLRDPEEATVSTAAVATSGATRPEKSEYLPYYERYISLVPDGDVISTLSAQIDETLALLRGLPASVASYRYAPDKWTVSEVVGHVIDTERMFAGRALYFARNDPARLPSMEQDDWMRNSNFDSYPLSELADELNVVRQSTVYLFKHMDEQAWTRRGIANNAEISVRALAYIIAGHELHHRGVLEARYL